MSFAPGKVILLGEHAVVYGGPALAGALDRGVRVRSVPGSGVLHVPAWGVEVRPGDRGGRLAEAYDAIRGVLARRCGASCRVDLIVRFELPVGAGLGSSAAMAVAITRALGEADRAPLDDAAVDEAAMAAETVFHGHASGIDHAVSARGGFGVYDRAAGLRPLQVCAPVPLVIGHTGHDRDTRGRVMRVAELMAARPEECHSRFATIASLVRRAARAVGSGDLASLGACMSDNQRHLAALEVSTPEIDRMCEIACAAGALGAKLTGGGGGGCVLALAPGREEAVREAWTRAGWTSFLARVGGDGPPAGPSAEEQRA